MLVLGLEALECMHMTETQTISVCTLHGQCPRTGRQQTTGLEKLLSHYIDTVNACDTKLADICRQKESAAACLFV